MQMFELRLAEKEDTEFLFESYKITLKPYVEWAWGWDENFQRIGFHKHHPFASFQVISVAGERAGALYVEDQENHNHIKMIFLLPKFQNTGIGSNIFQQEMARAKKLNKKLTLKVIRTNRAKLLYERLGFSVVEENEATYHMEY